jgi:tetratricopeptide (TPR) repeat protein
MNSYQKSSEKGLFSGLSGRTSSFVIALLTMFFLAASSVFSFGQSPEIRKAFRFIDIEQPSKGLSALEQLVSSNPTNSNYLYYLGLAQLRTGAKDKALANFEKGITANEKDGLNYAGKGHVRLLEKNSTDAKVQIDKALQLSKSKDAGVLRAVAEAYLTDTKYLLDAINMLNKAKSINGTDPEIHMLLGDALLMQNQQNAGPTVSSYERAATVDPKFAKAHYKVGKIYQRARTNDLAIGSFEKAIAIDPEYAPAYKDLGEIYYVNKQADKAVEAYEKYIKLTENPGQAKFQLAFFYFMAKKYDKADAIFKEVTTNPNVPAVAYRYHAYSLTEQGKSDEARTAFEKYFSKAKPEEIQAQDYTYLGKLQLSLKTPEGDSLANENFAKSISLDTTQVEAAQLHADTYFKRRKFAEAAAAYKQLAKIKPAPSTSDLFNLGRSYFYSLQFDKADSAFTQVAQKTPTMTVGYLWSAKARQQIDSTGAQALANPMFEKVIELGTADPAKNKKDLIDAYTYFGSYYVNIKPDIPKAKSYFEKILELDPSHAQAKEALKVINQPAPQNKGR